MNKTSIVIFGGIAVVAVVILGKSFIGNQQTASQTPTQAESTAEVANKEENSPIEQSEKASWYTDYSEEALAAATAEDGRAVIFFHAGWCPSCKTAAKDFEVNIDKIPSDVTILKADYDTATELKKKYNVVTQDTFVQVDGQGNALTTWNSGGEGIKTLLANVQ